MWLRGETSPGWWRFTGWSCWAVVPQMCSRMQLQHCEYWQIRREVPTAHAHIYNKYNFTAGANFSKTSWACTATASAVCECCAWSALHYLKFYIYTSENLVHTPNLKLPSGPSALVSAQHEQTLVGIHK